MNDDARIIAKGSEIPSHYYADQPYVVRTDDGAWLSVMTTGQGREGATGQFVITQRSTDRGSTWTDEQRMENQGSPENSWGVLLKGPSGRVFCFYVFNADNYRKVPADPESAAYPDGYCYRVDSLGLYVFRYSDDHGKSWSDARLTVPVREFRIDRENPTGGKIRYFWNVGKPFVHESIAYVPLHKVGGFGAGFFSSSEGAIAASADLLTVDNPANASWKTLPEGDRGIRAPEGHGSVAEEHSFTVLHDGTFFTVYRTISGYPACSYSRDRGRTWSEPDRMRFADGRPIKHPRAANFVWKCANGNYLYWFHNQGGPYVHEMHEKDATFPYSNRNPVWLSGGVEADSPEGRIIRWSEPEISLYDDDPFIRMSYPDLFEENGKLYVSETQKDVARVHELDTATVRGLWRQLENTRSIGPEPDFMAEPDSPIQELPRFAERNQKSRDYGTKDLRQGFSLDLVMQTVSDSRLVFDNRNKGGKGIALYQVDSGFEFLMSDGQYSVLAPIFYRWTGETARLTIIADGGPKIISAVCDGRFADGGDARQFGWTRFGPYLSDVNSSVAMKFGPALRMFAAYRRSLRVSEAVALHNVTG